MQYKRLFILVEGPDDDRFFKHIIKPQFEKRYDHVQFYQYAAQPARKVENFINSINAMKADYLVAADINDAPCVTYKKDAVKSKRIKNVNEDNIVVVIREIESWYIAGLDKIGKKKVGVSYNKKTDDLNKEQFNRLIPKTFTRIDFMQEILKHFRIETAAKSNKSFAYFIHKKNLP